MVSQKCLVSDWRNSLWFLIGITVGVGFLLFYFNSMCNAINLTPVQQGQIAPFSERRDDDRSWSNMERTPNLNSTGNRNVEELLPQTQIKIMSWNMQGVDLVNISARTKAAIKIILKEAPDAVFMQELRANTYSEYCTALYKDYGCISARANLSENIKHFVGILFKKSRFTILDKPLVVFFFNQTIRRALVLPVNVLGPVNTKMALITTHLIYKPEQFEVRLGQLGECFKIGDSFPQDYNVVLGGDLNLEEGEAEATVPSNFLDLWKEIGSPENQRYTWDIVQNEEAIAPNQPNQTRYDRFYFRSSNPVTMELVDFKMLRKDHPVEGTKLLISDHRAIVASFQLNQAEKQ